MLGQGRRHQHLEVVAAGIVGLDVLGNVVEHAQFARVLVVERNVVGVGGVAASAVHHHEVPSVLRGHAFAEIDRQRGVCSAVGPGQGHLVVVRAAARVEDLVVDAGLVGRVAVDGRLLVPVVLRNCPRNQPVEVDVVVRHAGIAVAALAPQTFQILRHLLVGGGQFNRLVVLSAGDDAAVVVAVRGARRRILPPRP